MNKLRRAALLLLIMFITSTTAGAVFIGAPDKSEKETQTIYAKKTVEYTDTGTADENSENTEGVTDDTSEDTEDTEVEKEEEDSEEAVDESADNTEEKEEETSPPKPVEITSISLDPKTLEIKTNEKVTISAKCLPSNASDTSILWFSSDSEIAEVSDTGEVTGIMEGVAFITVMSAASPLIYEICEVKVEKDYVSTIALGRKAVKLSVGSVMPIAVITAPSTAYDKTYTWTCDNEDVAEIMPGNIIKALKPGTATFTVTANDYKEDGRPAESKVFVTVITTADYYCTVGKAISFKADIESEEPESLIWNVYRLTSDSIERAGLNEVDIYANKLSCKFYGKVVGEYRIEITDPDNERNVQIIHVNVKEPVKKVVAYLKGDESRKTRRTELTVNQDGTDPQKIQLYAAVEPESATYKDVYWKSSKPDIASVDENGLVTPQTAGSSVITCISATDRKKSTFTVNVKFNSNTITLDKTEPMTLRVGTSARLKATLEKFKNSSTVVVWESSNPNAVTVKNGKITSVGVGTAVITASTISGNVSASVEVKSVIVPSKIVAASKKLELKPGGEAKIQISFEPYDVSETELIYESKNTDVAVVDGNGNVTAVGTGTTTVTATATAVNGKKVNISVIVR